jgi:hypothetical protein
VEQQRMAYFILETVRDADGNFIPCIAKENEPGYFKTSWQYGKDLDLANKAVDSLNQRMGYSPKEAAQIVASTFRKPESVQT